MGRPQLNYIRTHFSIPREMLDRLDHIAGPKGRSAFVRRALEQALDTAELAVEQASRGRPKGE